MHLGLSPADLATLHTRTEGWPAGLRWLQVQGVARPVVAPDWRGLLPGWTSAVPPDDVYLVVHVTPRRIDLFDESLDRGVRETLEIGDWRLGIGDWRLESGRCREGGPR